MTVKWIGYPNLMGFAGTSTEFFESLADAREWLREHGDPHFVSAADGESRDSLTLYMVTDPKMITDAEEYAGLGCPFDYPDLIMTFGPRGGIKSEPC